MKTRLSVDYPVPTSDLTSQIVKNLIRLGRLVAPLAFLTIASCARQTPPDPTYAGEWFALGYPTSESIQAKPFMTLYEDGTGKWNEMRVRWSVFERRSVVLAAPVEKRTQILASIGVGKIEDGMWKQEFRIVGPSKLELYGAKSDLQMVLKKGNGARL